MLEWEIIVFFSFQRVVKIRVKLGQNISKVWDPAIFTARNLIIYAENFRTKSFKKYVIVLSRRMPRSRAACSSEICVSIGCPDMKQNSSACKQFYKCHKNPGRNHHIASTHLNFDVRKLIVWCSFATSKSCSKKLAEMAYICDLNIIFVSGHNAFFRVT